MTVLLVVQVLINLYQLHARKCTYLGIGVRLSTAQFDLQLDY